MVRFMPSVFVANVKAARLASIRFYNTSETTRISALWACKVINKAVKSNLQSEK